MASERLQVILELITGQYKREAREAATATQGVATSAKNARTGVGGFKSSLDSSVGSLKALAGGAAIGAAVVGLSKLKDFANESIDAYTDLNESINAVNVSFGENARGIQDLGRKAATSLGLSNAEFNAFAVQMSSFVETISGPGGDVVGTMDDLTTRVADFASVMNLEVADAAEKFQSGLAGQTEPLRKFGIDVSAARVEAFALANGISDVGEKMTEAEKVQARYGLIMEQTAKTAGDFANTSGELANQTRITTARMENHRAIVGETLQVYRQWGNELSLISGTLLAQVALGLQEIQGEMSTGEGIIRRFEIQTGQAVGTVDEFVLAWRELNAEAEEWSGSGARAAQRAAALSESIDEMVDTLDLTTDELLDAVDNVDSYAHQLDLTAEEAEDFEQALRDKLNVALRENRENFDRGGGAARRWRDAQREAGGEAQVLADELERAAEAQWALITAMLEAIDPAVRASGAMRRMEEAQAALDEIQADSEATAKDVAQAQLDYAEAVLEAQGALDMFSAADPEESVRALATALRISNEEARAVLETLGILDGMVVNMTIRTTEISGNQSSTGRTTFIGGRQHGGPIESMRPYMVGEAGPELIIPRSSGFVVNNADVRAMIDAFRSGGRGSQGNTIINVNGSDGNTDIGTALALAGIYRRVESSPR